MREYSNGGVDNARSAAVFTVNCQVLATVSKCDKQGWTCEVDCLNANGGFIILSA